MAIKVTKRAEVTLTEEDVERLVDVCELARRMLGHGAIEVEYGEKMMWKIKNFINKIFGAGLV